MAGTGRDSYNQVAASLPYDNSTNVFTADETQAAIEEAKQNAEGFPRAGLALTANGTVGDLAWITYTELLANPRILFPVKTRLKEFTWVNNNVNIRALNFVFYKNGQAGGNIVYTYTPTAGQRTAGYGYLAFPSNLDWNAGDSLYVQCDYTAAGTSLSDLAAVCWVSRIP
jgi:hypothetical protein